jgi:nucleoside-diphosphate-sugar epimerase
MKKSRSVLLTGSSGEVATVTSAALLRAGHHVIALSRKPYAGLPGGTPPGLEHVVGDICHAHKLRPLVERADVVCHLAAFIPPDFADAAYAAQCFAVNSLATLQIATLSCELNKKLVYCSSGSLYAWQPLPVTEEEKLYPSARAPYYLGSKLLGEILVEHLRQTRGLRATVFRIGSVYGSRASKSVVARFISNAVAMLPLEVLYGGTSEADFVYVGDIARLLVLASEEEHEGVFNAGSGAATSIRSVAEAVCAAFPEFKPRIVDVTRDGATPTSFPALSMRRTGEHFSHVPTKLKDGLPLARKAILESEPSGHSAPTMDPAA